MLAWGEAQMTWLGLVEEKSSPSPSSGPSLSFSAGRGAEGGHVNDWLGLFMFTHWEWELHTRGLQLVHTLPVS